MKIINDPLRKILVLLRILSEEKYFCSGLETQNKNSPQMKQYANLAVCLDNGHAKSTPGKRSPYLVSGAEPKLPLYEYEFNRKVVTVLKQKLEKLGISVFIVCPEVEEDVKLTPRYKRANEYQAKHPDKKCIFISVHANNIGDGGSWTKARGWSAYTTKGQNTSDILAECLYDAAEEMFIPKGLKVLKGKTDGDRDYEENFTVIYGAAMPAVLTENFFYSNVDDCKYIMSDEGINDIADVHVKGITKFAEQHWKM